MTQPAEPQTPGAPQAPQAPAQPSATAAPTEPATPPPAATEPPAAPAGGEEPQAAAIADGGETPPWGDDANFDPARAWTLIQNLRKDKTAGEQARAQAAEQARNELTQSIGKALGLVKEDEPADPAKLTEQLTAQAAETRQAKLDLAVFQAASTAGADPNALLDSVSFRNKIAAIDPTDHLAISAAIGEFATSNPAFQTRSVPKPNPAQGGSGNGVPGSREAANAAEKAGDWKSAAALKSDQLLTLRQQTQ